MEAIIAVIFFLAFAVYVIWSIIKAVKNGKGTYHKTLNKQHKQTQESTMRVNHETGEVTFDEPDEPYAEVTVVGSDMYFTEEELKDGPLGYNNRRDMTDKEMVDAVTVQLHLLRTMVRNGHITEKTYSKYRDQITGTKSKRIRFYQ